MLVLLVVLLTGGGVALLPNEVSEAAKKANGSYGVESDNDNDNGN